MKSHAESVLWRPGIFAAFILMAVGFMCATFAGHKLSLCTNTFQAATAGNNEPSSYPHADLSPELRGLLAMIAVKGTVVTTVANNYSLADDPRHGTLDMFVESAQRAGVRNMFVAALDQATYDWLAARGVPTVLRRPPSNCEKAFNWVGCAKTDLARDVVALGYHMLLLDSDVLLFRNPMDVMPDGSFDVESSTDGSAEEAHGGPYGSSILRKVQGWPNLYSHYIAQLNYGVVWFKATRRMADTLSYFANEIRRGRVWDQAAFSDLMLLPSSPAHPWSGRHTVRVLDVNDYPNTCNVQFLLTVGDLARMRPVLLHFNSLPAVRLCKLFGMPSLEGSPTWLMLGHALQTPSVAALSILTPPAAPEQVGSAAKQAGFRLYAEVLETQGHSKLLVSQVFSVALSCKSLE